MHAITDQLVGYWGDLQAALLDFCDRATPAAAAGAAGQLAETGFSGEFGRLSRNIRQLVADSMGHVTLCDGIQRLIEKVERPQWRNELNQLLIGHRVTFANAEPDEAARPRP